MSGASLASLAIRSSFVEMFREPGVSFIFPSNGSVSRHPLPSTGSLGSVPPLLGYYEMLGRPKPVPLRFVSLRSAVPPSRAEVLGPPRFLGDLREHALFYDPGGPDALHSPVLRASVLPSIFSKTSAPT